MRSTRARILEGLRHGPMNAYDLATMINMAPFTVRGELSAMKRARIVRELLNEYGHRWELTSRGWDVLHAGDQIALEGVN